jgi:hypothetical protein
MIQEIVTEDLAIYKIKKREIVDDYTLRKSQIDRQKLRIWIKCLLRENDVIIFYVDDETQIEQFIVGTTKSYNDSAFDVPKTIEKYRDEEYETYYHIPFMAVPECIPYYISVDDITQFIVKNKNINEISKKIDWSNQVAQI